MRVLWLYLTGIFLLMQTALLAQDFNITKYGAIGDGKTLNTKAIQKAIDACNAAGGGQVTIPNGTFMSGTIKLKSNVTIYLAPTAILKGSPEYEDYDWEPYDMGPQHKRRALISGREITNVAIVGNGTIDGNGGHKNFQSEDPRSGIGGGVRPFPISISKSTNVKLRDFKMIDGAFWNIKIDGCENVLIDGLTIDSRAVANNDGIDIVDCSYTRISNCFIRTGDDGICIKSNRELGVKHVTVTNCVVTSYSNALKLGAVSKGGFEDIVFSNCTIYDTRLSGIAVEIVDGGYADRIVFSNITMNNVNGSIFIKADNRQKDKFGQIRNVIISNIIASGIGKWKANPAEKYNKEEFDERIGVVISGNEKCKVENVTFSNIHLQFAGGGTTEDAKTILVDKQANRYPDYHSWGVTPAYGINCNYVTGIRFKDIVIDAIKEDARPALYFQNSKDITLESIAAKVWPTAPSYVRFNNINSAFITNNRPVTAKIPYVMFEGDVKDISLSNNDLTKASIPFIKKGSVDEKQIVVSAR